MKKPQHVQESKPGISPVRLPLEQGVAGWVAKHAKSAYIDDAYSDIRFNPEVDAVKMLQKVVPKLPTQKLLYK